MNILNNLGVGSGLRVHHVGVEAFRAIALNKQVSSMTSDSYPTTNPQVAQEFLAL